MQTLEVQSLSSAERFVLWSLRLALSPSITSEEAQSPLAEGFRLARVQHMLPMFLDMADVLIGLWHQTQHVPQIHCTCCKEVGADEWDLLQVLAALQLGDTELAARHLRRLLPSAGITAMLWHALRVANAFSAAGWVIRLMSVDMTVAPRATAQTISRHALH